MGKLIVIEGLDGSGKTTQFRLLQDRLKKSGLPHLAISFPDYESRSSELIKMYLSGEFGKDPKLVNPYAASIFYAADRYASYKKHWEGYYKSGGVVIASRYVTSNAVHQASKLPEKDRKDYLDWLYDLEYNRIQIPKPDLVVFLDMPIDISEKLMFARYKGDNSKKDIHERDKKYLKECRNAALFAAEYSGWDIVKCYCDDRPLEIEQISDVIFDKTLRVLKKGV
ncbi:MAG TPA: deoxynucleoside kinase [Clostridiales bacterium]|nr:deoxynucleoside kinase [Clostridiales bacterium]